MSRQAHDDPEGYEDGRYTTDELLARADDRRRMHEDLEVAEIGRTAEEIDALTNKELLADMLRADQQHETFYPDEEEEDGEH